MSQKQNSMVVAIDTGDTKEKVGRVDKGGF